MRRGFDMSKETVFDFDDGNGSVPAQRHINPDGNLGGWVADTSSIDDDTFLHQTAKVHGYSRIGCGTRVGASVCIKNENFKQIDMLLQEFRS